MNSRPVRDLRTGLFLSAFPSSTMNRFPVPTVTLNGKTYAVDEDRLVLANVEDARDDRRFSDIETLREYTFWTEQLQPTVGRRVTHAEMVYDEDFDAQRPVLTFDDGTKLEMLQDEEGNGPGRFAYL